MSPRVIKAAVAVISLFLFNIASSDFNPEIGKCRKFKYEMDIKINEVKSESVNIVGFRLTSDVSLTIVWKNNDDQLLRLVSTGTRLINVESRPDEKNLLKDVDANQVFSEKPVYFHLAKGQIKQLFASSRETPSSLNLKRGIASLTQISDEREGIITEVDASGECNVNYQEIKGKLIKRKLIDSCKRPTAGEFFQENNVLGITLDSVAETIIELTSDKVGYTKITTIETHSASVNVRSAISSFIESRHSLTHAGEEASEDSLQGSTVAEAVQSAGDFTIHSIVSEPIIQQCIVDCSSPLELIANLQESLETDQLSTSGSAIAYLRLLTKLREVGKDTILDILRNENYTPILTQLIDIIAATQTSASHAALMDYLDFKDGNKKDILDRYLVATSFASHPNEQVLASLLEKLRENLVDEDIHESLALSLASVIHTYCINWEGCESTQVVKDAKNFFLERLQNADEERNMLIYLRAMGNALLADTLPLIVEYAANGKTTNVMTSAFDALFKFNPLHLTGEMRRVINSVYHQNTKQYEDIVRIKAANVILNGKAPTQDVINLYLSLSDECEVSTFVQKKISNLLANSESFRNDVFNTLKNPSVYNYDLFSKIGFSNSYGSVFADTSETKTVYNMDMLFTASSMLRNSDTDFILNSKNDSLYLFSVGLYATGMEGFLGGEDEADAETSAGLSLSILGKKLRPFSFFNGLGELMSLAWGGSEQSMTALQGNLLLHDYSKVLGLQSGVFVDLQVQSDLSIKLSGDMEFSLWDRNSLTMVFNRGAMALKLDTLLNTGFINIKTETVVDSETVIDFVTAVDFSDMPFKMCLMMTHPDFSFRQERKSVEQLVDSGKKVEFNNLQKIVIPEKTFRLFPENSAMCNEMYGSEE